MALGALATAATFVLVLINQKGTQKQIDSLSQMAEMFSLSLSIGTYSSWKQYISENSDKFEG